MIRRAETDADLAAYAATWNAVWPDEPISLDFVLDRLRREPDRLYLLAEHEGDPVGTGFAAAGSTPGRGFVTVAVLPEWRRAGLGGGLLEHCLARARELELSSVLGTVREDDPESVRFVEHRGFVVADRVVALALDLRSPPAAAVVPDGIEIVELDERRFAEAYAVFTEGVADIPESSPVRARPLSEWAERVRSSLLTLVALEAGVVVGFADVELRSAEAGVLDNNLTTVRRSHRGRGIAEALKRTQIAWATEHGYHRLITGNHEANEPMRRLNEKLGYQPLPALLDVSRRLDWTGSSGAGTPRRSRP